MARIDDMAAALAERAHPSVTVWNRLEGRPVTASFERALRAEVRDALWMLTRQWQSAEFRGEDAGSPILAKVHAETAPLTRFRAGAGPPKALDLASPLEAQVETRPVVLDIGGDMVGLDLRLAMGHRWLKLIDGLATSPGLFRARYAFQRPDPQARAQAGICAHPNALQSVSAVARARAMDGFELYRKLKGGDPDVAGIPAGEAGAVQVAATAFVEWVERAFPGLSAENPAWDPARFEYRFACAAPASGGERVLAADEYASGSVDWYVFDVDREAAPLGAVGAPAPMTRTTLPTPVRYSGMPNPRWWTMEDGRTNFGAIRPDTTDLGKLLFMEFGLIYSNDWFLTPITVLSGSTVTMKGLMVTDVFGERLWIEGVDEQAEDDRRRFSLFTTTVKGSREAPDRTLLVAPTAFKVQESRPVEDLLLIRDEMANMVWAIEKIVPARAGGGASGADAARETRAYHERFALPEAGAAAPAPNDAALRYELMTDAPEHWIPFVAAQQRRLQRATMLRLIPRDPQPPEKVRPRTSLLRVGLGGGGFFVPQDEVPRAGARVTLAFQRTRWLDGQVPLWVGARKQTGRGEGWSGLAFDRLVPKQA